MKFHHIGYLTNNLSKTYYDFKKLKYKKIKRLVIDKNFKVKIQFLKNKSNIIELIKPDKNNYGLTNILKKKNYAYHFAYTVNDLNKTLLDLKKKI